jgi:uncharacterized membrane protein
MTPPESGENASKTCCGIIYFDRSDPSLFVEKPHGLGYTLNFGNAWSWLVLLVVIAVPTFFLLRHIRR